MFNVRKNGATENSGTFSVPCKSVSQDPADWKVRELNTYHGGVNDVLKILEVEILH